ncbi:MAG: DEAD/DEAH box helicase, partial [Halobacteriaceae archaeon]
QNESTPVSEDSLDEPLIQYQLVLESILYDEGYLPSGLECYGTQQSSRNSSDMTEYRDQYGNGDWIIEYECIQVEQSKEETINRLAEQEIVKDTSALVRPVAPISDQPLPELVSEKHGLKKALSLLSEFPVEPTTTDNNSPSDNHIPVKRIYSNLRDDIGDKAILSREEITVHNEFSKTNTSDTHGEETDITETLTWLHEESSHSDEIVYNRTESAQESQFEEMVSVATPVADATHKLGIKSLFTHQKAAIEAAIAGDDVMLSTETASGKSLPYRLLALDRAYTEQSTALYTAPTKALINDQASSFEDFITELPDDTDVSVNVYTGDTPEEKRRQIRRDPPNILLMTPELVHMSLLPYHNRWDKFIRNLETIII